MNYTRAQVLQACVDYGPLVTPIVGIDSAQLLAALAENESSMGANCGPRLEPAWDFGGVYAKDQQQQTLLEEYGQAAACSYGPLQVMFYNASGYTPTELNTDLTLAIRASIAYMNTLIREWHPQTVADVGEMWNSGSLVNSAKGEVPAPGVVLYCQELVENYQKAAGWLPPKLVTK